MGLGLAAKLGVLAGSLAIGVVGLLVAEGRGEGRPARLVAVQDVPDDVMAEMQTTWDRFIDRFAGRRGCFADARVVLVDHVERGDARYVPADASIEIEIPTTPARFRESLVHELAHHVERTCGEFEELRAELHVAFGGTGRPWTGGARWEETPSELWAESVVALVNGERLLHADEMPIDAAIVDEVAAWGRAGD